MSTERLIRNIGIFAHVDSGKTTLTEQMLRCCGAIREAGSVDDGTAHTDKMDIERRRGISIRATSARMIWKGVNIHVIDTPGHADFSAEVERALWALDAAVLLLSAVEGVQPQTEIFFRAIRRVGIPMILFINKMDREGANGLQAVEEAKALLSDRIVDVANDDHILTCWAEEDDQVLVHYLEGKSYPRDALLGALRSLAKQGKAYPAFYGSALHNRGVDVLLDAVFTYLPAPAGDDHAPLSGIVYAIDHDKSLGRSAMVRLFSGTLKNRDALTLVSAKKESFLSENKEMQIKISQIRDIALEGRGADQSVLRAGEIGAVYGMGSVQVGQVLGEASLLPRKMALGEINTPLLMAKVVPADPAQKNDLRLALEMLSMEDPLLGVMSYVGETHIRVMGAVQLEVLSELIASRFHITVSFDKPNVIYRETIAQSAVGFYAYTMPKPCWAVIKFQIDPLPRGTGIRYQSIVSVNEILPRYQHQIEQALPTALRQGMLGWQVDDVAITLIGGEHHPMHTHPLDFILATPVAFMDGLQRGGSILLEPILEMEIRAPEHCRMRILSEIIAMRGEIMDSSLHGDRVHIITETPLATSIDFSTKIAAITAGRGTLSTRLLGYRDCDQSLGATCPRHGVHPLDTAKYILAARNAMGDGIFTLSP